MTEAHIDSSESRKELRRILRERRRALTPMQQQHAAQAVLRQLMKQPFFLRAQHVALYLAADGELNPAVIAQKLRTLNKHCYLPVAHPTRPRELWFVRYTADTVLTPNRFGIDEPDPFTNHRLPAHLLDVVLMPLVGFDEKCNRLGMGGGFYDYTFRAFKNAPRNKPRLIGLAHHCQQVDALTVEEWDVPLTAVITDQAMLSRPAD